MKYREMELSWFMPVSQCCWCAGNDFPFLDFSRDEVEQRMRLRLVDGFEALQPCGITAFQLGQEMAPFIVELTLCDWNEVKPAFASYFTLIKLIASSDCFQVNIMQVGGQSFGRFGRGPEPVQLRMIDVAPCLPAKNRLS